MKPTRIVVVDDQDRVIGSKLRSDLELADIYRVSCLWLTNTSQEVLLAQRSFAKKNSPGKWGPAVAGTVEADETYEQNIIREAKEELGIELRDYTYGHKQFIDTRKQFFVQWFEVVDNHVAEDFVIQAAEVERVAWFEPQYILDWYERNPDDFTENAHYWISLFLTDAQ